MTFISDDRDFVLTRDNDKACLFNTSLVSVSATKTSGGTQLYTLKKNSAITNICPVEEFKSSNIEFYRTKQYCLPDISFWKTIRYKTLGLA